MTTQVNRASGLKLYLNIFMALLYAAMGVLIGIGLLVPDLARANRTAVSATLLVYAAYRVFRLFNRRKQQLPDTTAE